MVHKHGVYSQKTCHHINMHTNGAKNNELTALNKLELTIIIQPVRSYTLIIIASSIGHLQCSLQCVDAGTKHTSASIGSIC